MTNGQPIKVVRGSNVELIPTLYKPLMSVDTRPTSSYKATERGVILQLRQRMGVVMGSVVGNSFEPPKF